MPKWYLIARMEFSKLIRRRAFLFATVGMPLLIVAVIGISVYSISGGKGSQLPVGYVDESGVIPASAVRPAPAGDALPVLRFESREEAEKALASGAVQAVYVFAPDYRQTLHVQLLYWQKLPGEATQESFVNFIRQALAAKLNGPLGQRLESGVDVLTASPRGEMQNVSDRIIGFLIPFVLGMAFVFVVMATAGYLLQAVATEKENRMVEVMFTSVSPLSLISGKALGLIAVALSQMLAWMLAAIIGIGIASQRIAFLQNAHVPWDAVAVIVVFFLPTFALVAAFMITIGSITDEIQQGQQIAGLLNLGFVAPFFFVVLIFTRPDSPLLVFFTLFPTTALTTIALRWGAGTIPWWQLALSWLLLSGSAILALRLAARVFRTAMLRYGQPLSLRGAWRLMRQGR